MIRRNRRFPFLAVGAIVALACLNDPLSPGLDRRGEVGLDTAGGVSPVLLFTLTPGDELSIDFRSHGCFHDVSFAVRLVRDSRGATVTVINAPSSLAPGWHLESSTHVGMPQLDSLERLFSFYRRNSARTCTTIDSIGVTSVERGIIRHESFVDGSCATFDSDSLLTIGQLLPLVREQR